MFLNLKRILRKYDIIGMKQRKFLQPAFLITRKRITFRHTSQEEMNSRNHMIKEDPEIEVFNMVDLKGIQAETTVKKKDGTEVLVNTEHQHQLDLEVTEKNQSLILKKR